MKYHHQTNTFEKVIIAYTDNVGKFQVLPILGLVKAWIYLLVPGIYQIRRYKLYFTRVVSVKCRSVRILRAFGSRLGKFGRFYLTNLGFTKLRPFIVTHTQQRRTFIHTNPPGDTQTMKGKTCFMSPSQCLFSFHKVQNKQLGKYKYDSYLDKPIINSERDYFCPVMTKRIEENHFSSWSMRGKIQNEPFRQTLRHLLILINLEVSHIFIQGDLKNHNGMSENYRVELHKMRN